mgnify:CR=1 FL=1
MRKRFVIWFFAFTLGAVAATGADAPPSAEDPPAEEEATSVESASDAAAADEPSVEPTSAKPAADKTAADEDAADEADAGEPISTEPPRELLFPNSDFEQGDLEGWRTEGDAFDAQPVKGDNVRVREPDRTAMPRGQYWIGTYEHQRKSDGFEWGGTQGNAPQGGLLSDGFEIKRPYIAFLVGGGCSEQERVELIVNAEVVHSATGAFSPIMREVVWDVSDSVGKKGMIYIYDRSSEAWGIINADDFRFLEKRPVFELFPNSDFELGDLSNWTATGEAFAHQPTKGDNVAARTDGKISAKAHGKYWIGTYEQFQGKEGQEAGATQGDEPQGILKSIPFTIRGSVIQFLVGGSDANAVEVRLLVHGRPVRSERGRRSPEMQIALWDVSDYLGQSAEIEIVDRASTAWGHICADNFRYARLD